MTEDSKNLWPDPILDGHSRAWTLDTLYHNREYAKKPEEREFYREGQDWLMGYALPPFQRPVVWDEARMIRFIESAVLGLHLGTFVYNMAPEKPMEIIDGKEYFPRTDKWLIDGQQRLTALDRFFGDQFPVFGHYWSDLSQREQRRFLSRTSFPAFETRIDNEHDLRVLYDRLNFGGVAHTADQRALPEGETILGFGR